MVIELVTIENYHTSCIGKAKKEILSKGETYILGCDVDELVDYYFNLYELPLIEKNEALGIELEQLSPLIRTIGTARIPISRDIRILIHYHIKHYDKLEIIKRRSSTYLAGYSLLYYNNEIVKEIIFPSKGKAQERYIESEVNKIEKTIGFKNADIKKGNARIKSSLKIFFETYKNRVASDTELLDTLIKKIPYKLVRKTDTKYKPVQLRVKKKIRPIFPESRVVSEPILEIDEVEAILSLIKNQGYAFETTPQVYSKHCEEELRDIILGMLNAIFEGEATGETFVKKGKTDIHLILEEGSILSAECKIWDGPQKYHDSIDQFFKYLKWRQNFGIIITFSKRKGFSEVIAKAKDRAHKHSTIISEKIIEKDESHFITVHRFPEDPSKTVTIHHLLFTLFYD